MINLLKISVLGIVLGVFLLYACSDDPSCTDGIQNQFEEGIDCSGPCPPCIGGVPQTTTGTGTGTGSGSGSGGSDSDSGGSDSDSGSDSDAGSDTGGGVTEGTFTAEVNGSEASYDASVITLAGLSIVAIGPDFSMTFLLPASASEGMYEIGTGSTDVTLQLAMGLTVCTAGAGSMNLTEVTSSSIAGTFSFNCSDGLSADVSNGEFSLNY